MTHRTQSIVSRAARIEPLERRMLLSLSPAGAEFRVNTVTTSDQSVPAVAADADGDFVVAWSSYYQDGSLNGIFARRYNAAGTAQGTEFRVNSFTTGAQRFPSVAMDADGDFVVAWDSAAQDGSSTGIFAQRYNAAGVAQGGEFRVNTFTTGEQFIPEVAMNAGGDFVVTWSSLNQDGSNAGVYAQRYNALGVAQGGEFRVNTFTTASQNPSGVAMDPSGDFVIAWTSQYQDGSSSGAYAQRYNALGVAQGAEFRVNATTTGNQNSPDVAIDATGDFVVTWTGIYDIFAQRYDAAGVQQGSEFRVNTFTTGAQLGARVAMDADGDFLIAWTDGFIGDGQDGSGAGVFAQSFNPAGVAQGGEFRVNTFTTNFQSNPDVSLDAGGDAIIAWQSNSQEGPGGLNGVYAQRYQEIVLPAGPEFRVNTHTTNGQDLPSAAMDTSGNFVVVWESNGQDGSLYGIYGQRYNAAGVAQGPEFLVNNSTSGHQVYPEVAMDADGDFVVVWANYATTPDGIYARRYDAAGVAQGPEFNVDGLVARASSPAVAMDADGDFVISWDSYGQDGSRSGVYGQRYNAAGVAQGEQFRINTYTTNNQLDSSVAMDAAGNFVVTWNGQGSGDTGGIFAQRYNAAGEPQGGEFRVNADTFLGQFDSSVAMDADGDFVIAWTTQVSQTGLDSDVLARRYDESGVAQGGEFRVNTFTSDRQQRAAVAMSAHGSFVVAWESFSQVTPNFHSMHAQRYDASGVSVSGEFPVSTSPITPPPIGIAEHTMAMDADGDFVVAWTNFGLDGSSYGVYAQRFAAPTAPAPTVISSSFLFQTAPHRLPFTFSENVSASLGTNDILLQNLTTSTTIPSSDLSLSYDSATNTATFSYTGNAGGFTGVLPDGNYRATLIAAGITNGQGVPLASNHVFNFFFLNGDANRDGRVNLADFNILAGNFGQSPRDFTQADFTYDTVVNLADFNVLAGRFGRELGPDGQIESANSGEFPLWAPWSTDERADDARSILV